ncbi:hypothetical protein [Flavobacterium tegetincola]|uniref:hypothetical protein n=1 Tax=Flavobacterium tegetincola TaxID=150172 RepID=UPI00047B5757|nr:hypothetical protein [Flavobacterium tegetincola]
MRLLLISLLLITTTLFAQPLTLTIDSVFSKEEHVKERIFTIKYSLKNNSADTLHFFLDPKNVSPSSGGSLTKEIYYKIYENDKFIEIGAAFNQFFTDEIVFKFDESFTQSQKDSVMIDYLAKKLDENPEKLLKIYQEEGSIGLLDSSKDYMQKHYKRVNNYYHTLLPNQIEHLSTTFNWNKNRYYYLEPNEFYLDENAKHYFELTFVALKEEYKSNMDKEVFNEIMKMPHFIKGVFVSNKVEINFN